MLSLIDVLRQFLLFTASPRPVQSNAAAGGKRRGGAGGLNKLCGVSPELQAIVGEPSMTRTQVRGIQTSTSSFSFLCLSAVVIVTTCALWYLRLSNSFGPIYEKIIFRIQVTRERLFATMHWGWFLKPTALTCLRWISFWQSTFCPLIQQVCVLVGH